VFTSRDEFTDEHVPIYLNILVYNLIGVYDFIIILIIFFKLELIYYIINIFVNEN
jgi:hypothetical protein